MKSIGVAIIGAGFMGRTHFEALRRIGVPVVGMLGVSAEESREAAERLGVPAAFDSFDDVLADDRVQAVHICTPNRLHFDMALRALGAGKHVLCEKPLALTSQESAELVRVASQCPNLAAGVNHNIRFYPLCLEARQRVRDGALGRVFHVCGSYTQDWLLLPTDYNWRVLVEEGGALRAVADIGTHWLDLVHAITGLEVQAVCADLLTVHPRRQRPKGEVETFASGKQAHVETEPVDIATEDYATVMLRFQGGARGCLYVSQVTAGRKNCLRWEVAASKGSLVWDSERPNEMWLGHRDRANELLPRDPSLLSDIARDAATYPGGHNEGYGDTFKQCFRAFYQYIAAGDFKAVAPFPTFADGHREIVLCDAILASHRRQGWVTLPEDTTT